MNNTKTFSELFREAKFEAQITFRQIKAKTGLSIGYLSDVMQGRKRPPDLEIIKQIEEILGVNDSRLTNAAQKERKNNSPEELTKKLKDARFLLEAALIALQCNPGIFTNTQKAIQDFLDDE